VIVGVITVDDLPEGTVVELYEPMGLTIINNLCGTFYFCVDRGADRILHREQLSSGTDCNGGTVNVDVYNHGNFEESYSMSVLEFDIKKA